MPRGVISKQRRIEMGMSRRVDVVTRIMRRIVMTDHGCWLWPGAQQSRGYGSVGASGKSGKGNPARSTHRVMFEHKHGPAGDDVVIDHLCRNKLCCNPDHLEAVTNSENARRASRGRICSWRPDRCPAGHVGDVYEFHGCLICRQCGIEASGGTVKRPVGMLPFGDAALRMS